MKQILNLAINGFGRIGRLAFRIALEKEELRVVAINDLTPVDQLAHLLKYDSVHGKFNGKIEIKEGDLIVNDQKIRVTAQPNPEDLNWGAVDVDLVLECTGIFKSHEKASKHLIAGAKKVLISAPSEDAPMFVMGVNHTQITTEQKIISNASCTTNCLAVLAKGIQDHFGIKEALMTTVHAVTASQSPVDQPATKNMRIKRSALSNIIPTSTGAATAVTKVIPELEGKLTGMALRVPVTDVSVVDLTVRTEKSTSLQEIKDKFLELSKKELKGFLAYTDDEVVSQDFVSDTHSCIFDADASMELNANFFKLIAWYDNEYGYASKLIDLASYMNILKE